ncbi:MAG: hypothetical protein A2041_02550 [Bacteroidetes bacterium GWA2_31_9b]|nr:MAG: hypothetical protein A2041_02550 [Bacteroidetes bacterium GWA2_31_9b]
MKILVIHVFIILSIVLPQHMVSQNLPNYDLENWESDGSFDNPISWSTSNYSAWSIINFNTVIQENTDAYSGSSCAKLVTVSRYADGDYAKIAGLITLGHFDVNIATRKAVVTGGVPCSVKPGLLSGYYKYSTPGIDSCIMSIYFTKFNSQLNRTDTIGSGIFTSGTTTEWTHFEAPVSYSSTENPDTMNIIILSSDTSLFVEGSTLYIDKLAIDIATTINQESIKDKKFSIYPNPATDLLFLDIFQTNNSSYCYSIINSSGVRMKQSTSNSDNEIIDLSAFASGIYFFEIHIDNYRYIESFVIN